MAQKRSGPAGARSGRKYPYYGLKAGIDVAEKVYLKGGGRVSRVQAAELLEVKTTSSVFEMRVITAVQFGLVKRSDGLVEVTDLGRRIVRPASESERAMALSDAFSMVPLYKEVRSRFEGMPLPDESGLKNVLIRDYGIAENQKNDAYNLMMASAKEAGILVTKSSGLWFSTLSGSMGTATGEEVGAREAQHNGDANAQPAGEPHSRIVRHGLHPSIEGLLGDLPQPGGDWESEDRRAWESALIAILDVVYPASRARRDRAES